jgi:gliding motility-associated-like protein
MGSPRLSFAVKAKAKFFRLLIPGLLLYATTIGAQVNLVPNPGFEGLSDCALDYGRADKAVPWQVVNPPLATPDLFHFCSESGFFVPPSGCFGVFPHTGEGMAGLAQMSVEERIYARLTAPLPPETDIYVAFSFHPRQKCGDEFETFCYSNTNGLSFTDIEMQWQQVVLESDTLLDYTEDWTTMSTCYQSTGREALVLLGNVKTAAEEIRDCDYIQPDFNSAYFYIDDVVVAPFDVVPDTIMLCGADSAVVDAAFYDLPIAWSDGWQGGLRAFTREGPYTVTADAGECLLMDQTIVVRIPDESREVAAELCRGSTLSLQVPVPAVWPGGDTSTVYTVSRPGLYIADLLSECGERQLFYQVSETDCSINSFVPNAFSPNGDGINDELVFFFKSDYAFEGRLMIFDRWGNQLMSREYNSTQPFARWDATFKGKQVPVGVYVWSYEYRSIRDGERRVVSGDVSLVR